MFYFFNAAYCVMIIKSHEPTNLKVINDPNGYH